MARNPGFIDGVYTSGLRVVNTCLCGSCTPSSSLRLHYNHYTPSVKPGFVARAQAGPLASRHRRPRCNTVCRSHGMLFCTSAPMFGQRVAERRAHVIPHAGARKITLSVHVDIVSNLPVDVCERRRPASSSPADHTGFLCSEPRHAAGRCDTASPRTTRKIQRPPDRPRGSRHETPA